MAKSKVEKTDELEQNESKEMESPQVKHEEEYEELNLDKKVTVRSIAGWTTGFTRLSDGMGDVTIVAEGTARLSRNEIIAQVQGGNTAFSGFDGRGSHATYYIEDEATRRELGFDSDEGKQEIFSADVVKRLFSIKNQNEFEDAFKQTIVTRAEKYSVLPTVKKLGINDYAKIRFVENYTGFRMQ